MGGEAGRPGIISHREARLGPLWLVFGTDNTDAVVLAGTYFVNMPTMLESSSQDRWLRDRCNGETSNVIVVTWEGKKEAQGGALNLDLAWGGP